MRLSGQQELERQDMDMDRLHKNTGTPKKRAATTDDTSDYARVRSLSERSKVPQQPHRPLSMLPHPTCQPSQIHLQALCLLKPRQRLQVSIRLQPQLVLYLKPLLPPGRVDLANPPLKMGCQLETMVATAQEAQDSLSNPCSMPLPS